MGSSDRRIHTLLEVANSLQSVIGKAYSNAYWIKAEIARLNFYPKSGHAYPDLVYKEEGKVLAEMRSIIWNKDFVRINKSFLDTVKAELKDGMQILFKATISYHPKYGLTLNISDVEPAFTLGEMAREKAETIQKLKEKEIFNLNKQLLFPELPKRLAVISVSTSKGYHDFLNIIENNKEGFAIESYLFSALLQGERCAKSILEKLRIIKSKANYFDAVLIIRGGGGDVGLNAYDDYELTECIATFPLPVVTGIGHSTNLTVAEMVAHSNKITPTDVAYFIIEKFMVLKNKIDNLERLLINSTTQFLLQNEEQLNQSAELLQIFTKHFIQSANVQLDSKMDKVRESVKYLLQSLQESLLQHQINIKNAIHHTSNDAYINLDCLFDRTRSSVNHQMNMKEKDLSHLSKHIQLLHPENVLKRGYSITTINGKSIKDSHSVKKGDEIKTILKQGSITSTVN